MIGAVFSDVDGTLLNSRNEVSPRTRDAILALRDRGIPFIIASARSPFGITPIQRRIGLRGAYIAYSGALIRDEAGALLYNVGFRTEEAAELLHSIEQGAPEVAWIAYIDDEWYVADRSDPRIVLEERFIGSMAREASRDRLPECTIVNKLLCIGTPEQIDGAEQYMKALYPQLAIYKSCERLLEIMTPGTNKAASVRRLCDHLGIDIADTVAFGDNYNDVEMLEAVGRGVLMGNAPEALRVRLRHITQDNDHDGIATELDRLMDP